MGQNAENRREPRARCRQGQREHWPRAPSLPKRRLLFRRYPLPWDEADAHRLRGRLLAPLGRRYRPQAVESLEAAIETYRHLGADPRWTDRVEAARQRLGAAWRSAARYCDGLTSRPVEILRPFSQ